MIDVVFLILGYFLLTGSFHAEQRRLPAVLEAPGDLRPVSPSAGDEESRRRSEILVRVRSSEAAAGGGDAAPRYVVGRREFASAEALGRWIASAHRRDRPVRIVPDGAATWQDVIAALAAGRRGGGVVGLDPPVAEP